MSQTTEQKNSLSYNAIFKTWWPLAISWLMMSFESTLLAAVVARLPEARLSLAASGGIMQPIRQVMNSPITMLLSASTALVRDWATYRKLLRFMTLLSGVMTGLLILFTFTPLYYFLAQDVLGAPPELYQLARWGLMASVPICYAVAYRRLHQGILIRNGLSNAIMTGTVIRITGYVLVLALCYWLRDIPGTVVEAAALSAGVVAEAIYTGIRVQPVLKYQVQPAPPGEPLTWRAFFAFYIPLVFTSLLNMIWSPISSMSISRMPRAIDSLAVLPVVNSLISLFRSFGLALNEVTVTLLDKPNAPARLAKFALYVGIATTSVFCLIALTPLSDVWFGTITGLAPDLAALGQAALLIAIPLPALSVIRSWSQGILLFGRKTRSISEAMAISLVALVLILVAGVMWGKTPGLYFGVAGLLAGNIGQATWLWSRGKLILEGLRAKTETGKPVLVS